MNLERYLERIQYTGPLNPDLATLSALQRAHLLTVPFENLSIHYHQPIILDEDLLYTKIVINKRGGFCYELNALFASLLRQIGFDVALLSAGVMNSNGDFGPAFDHMILRVDLDEAYLVDVGFGDSFQSPLRIAERGEQHQGLMSYQISRDGDAYIFMQKNNRESDAAMTIQHRFTLQPHALIDFKAMCEYHQTSPQSHFTQKRICSRATTDGRISLSDMRLIVTRDGIRDESILATEQNFSDALNDYFSIKL